MVLELFDLTGRVALVSGAGQNMGRATALAFAEAGADLLICDYAVERGFLPSLHTLRSSERAAPTPLTAAQYAGGCWR
jgi:NAD(P)-dependent dehydrogenase (short-subunit alcohol dehydrogenase family)